MSEVRNRVKVIGGMGPTLEKKWYEYFDQYYATKEGKGLVDVYLKKYHAAVIEIKLVPGGNKNGAIVGMAIIRLGTQGMFGLRGAPGLNGTYVKLVGLRSLAHELFHALAQYNRNDENLAVASANKVVKQHAINIGNPSSAGVRVDYEGVLNQSKLVGKILKD